MFRSRLDAATLAAAGTAAQESGHFEEGLYCLDLALRERPHDPVMRWHRALCKLALHDYTGWTDYEMRLHDSPLRVSRMFRHALTVEFLKGVRVVVHDEQGVGDSIMFASCLPQLCAVARSVRFDGDERLRRILQYSIAHVGQRENFNAWDVPGAGDGYIHVAIGSLAHAFRPRLESFPGVAYLSPPPECPTFFGERTPGVLRVGLCWQGGTPGTRRALRSMPGDLMRRSLDVDGAVYVNLTHDAQGAYLGQPAPPGTFADFGTLAAFMVSLDLIVTVQCSIAHLAGALGLPCIVLLPAAPEWRYGARGASMPWYSSLCLMRQDVLGDWTAPLEKARLYIGSLVKARDSAL